MEKFQLKFHPTKKVFFFSQIFTKYGKISIEIPPNKTIFVLAKSFFPPVSMYEKPKKQKCRARQIAQNHHF